MNRLDSVSGGTGVAPGTTDQTTIKNFFATIVVTDFTTGAGYIENIEAHDGGDMRLLTDDETKLEALLSLYDSISGNSRPVWR